MKPIKGSLITAVLVVLVFVIALTAGWLTANAGAPPQATTESEETTEEPLPDFQPTERLPSDSAVAFPTDI